MNKYRDWLLEELYKYCVEGLCNEDAQKDLLINLPSLSKNKRQNIFTLLNIKTKTIKDKKLIDVKSMITALLQQIEEMKQVKIDDLISIVYIIKLHLLGKFE